MRSKSVLYKFSVLFCLVVNIVYVTVDYMSYKTETNAAYTYPITLEMPKLSLCFDLFASMSSEDESRKEDLPQFYLNGTLTQILGRLPPASQVIKSCRYRNFTLNLLEEPSDGQKCDKVFEVVRYKMQGFACYRIQVMSTSLYSYHSVVNSLYEPRQLFHLVIDDPLASESIFFPLLHLTEYPDEERAFQREIFKPRQSLNYISYGLQETKSLPAPYQSRCAPLSPLACFQSCIDSSYRDRGFMTDSAIVREDETSSSLQLVPPHHSMETVMNSSRLECHTKCKFDACELSLVDTRISPPYNTSENLEMIIETLNRLPLKIEHDEKFSLVNYLTQVASVISIWTAVSFVSLNHLFNLRLGARCEQLLKKRIDSQYKLLQKIIAQEVFSAWGAHRKRVHLRLKTKSPKLNLIFLSLVIRVFVLACLTWQLINVVTNYFTYKTTVRLEYELNSPADVPTVAICLPYQDLFNLRLPSYVTEDDYDEYFRSIDSRVNHTVEELLRVAAGRSVVHSCSWRNVSDRFKPLVEYNSKACSNMFNIDPFLASQHVCYSVQPVITTLTSMKQSDIRFLVADPGVVYSLTLADNFRVKRVRLFIYFKQKFPNWVTDYASVVGGNDKGKEIFLSYRHYKINLLPAPYDTRCSSSISVCYFHCLDAAIQRFDRLSYSKIESGMLRRKQLSYIDLTNDTIYSAWRRGEEVCERKCPYFSCHFEFTSARPTASRATVDSAFKISAETPVAADSIMRTVPVMQFYELVYQVFCCLSFWLGFSFFGVNPFRRALLRMRRKTDRSIRLKVKAIEKAINRLMPSTTQAQGFQTIHSIYKKRPRERIVFLIAAFACLLHIVYSLKTYLSYPSYIDVEQSLEDRTNYTFFLCLDLAELLARDERPDVKSLSIGEKTRLLNHTIDYFFAHTPPESEIIDACTHWGLAARSDKLQGMKELTDRIMFFTTNKSICKQIYSVQKMVYSNSMCYSFILRNFSHWSRVRWKNTLNGERTFFEIFTKSSLLTSSFSLVPCFESYMPVSSSAWAQNMVKDVRYNNYRMTYVRYVQTILPSPYPHPSFSPFVFDRCLGHCVNSRLKNSNLTFSSRFYGSNVPSTIKYYNFFDRQRYEKHETLTKLIDTCERGCAYYNDHILQEKKTTLEVIVPVVSVSRDPANPPDTVLFEMVFTTVPAFFISYKLRLSLFEELINLGSIMSIWFGFSVISLARFSKAASPSIKDIEAVEKRVALFSVVSKVSWR